MNPGTRIFSDDSEAKSFFEEPCFAERSGECAQFIVHIGGTEAKATKKNSWPLDRCDYLNID